MPRRMAWGRRLHGVAFHGEQGAVVGRQDQRSCLRPVALATTSITGSLVFGGKKRGAKLGQDESSSSEALEQDETGWI
eukprot:COSAG06_NODE_15965_length_1032_cov_1.217578_2_plen_77_part_01